MFTKDSNLLIKYISKKVPKTALFKEYCELFDEFDKVSYEKKLNEVKSFSEEYTSITKINDSFVSDDINQEIHKLKKFKQLILLTNKSNPNYKITFTDAFPTSLSSVQLDTTQAGLDPIIVDVTFNFKGMFNVTKIV